VKNVTISHVKIFTHKFSLNFYHSAQLFLLLFLLSVGKEKRNHVNVMLTGNESFLMGWMGGCGSILT
jgi:hypothetical protein